MVRLLKSRDEIDLALHIESNYILTAKDFTYEELAETYGVSVNLIKKIAAARQWDQKLGHIKQIIRDQLFLYDVARKFPDLAVIDEALRKTEDTVNLIENHIEMQLKMEKLKPRDLESLARTAQYTFDMKLDLLDERGKLLEKSQKPNLAAYR